MQFIQQLSRLKHTERWMGRRTVVRENVKEHSFDVASIAAVLASISNEAYGAGFDVGEVVLFALFHDATEAITGDLPSPVKYANPTIRDAYKAVERAAGEQLIAVLQTEARGLCEYIKEPDDENIKTLVKAADQLSQYLYATSEVKSGNNEFAGVLKDVRGILEKSTVPAVSVYLARYDQLGLAAH